MTPSIATGSLSGDICDGGCGSSWQILYAIDSMRAGERLLAGQQLVEHDAGAEQVRAMIARPCPWHCSGDMYDGVPITMPVIVRFDVSMRAMPKSATLSAPVGREDQVRRLDVAMDDAAAHARTRARAAAAPAIATSWRELEPRLAVQVFAQPGAVDVLHRDERDVVVLAVLVDADDVRMVQAARGRASFLKRAMNCAARSGSTRSLRIVLIATVRSMCGSNAL